MEKWRLLLHPQKPGDWHMAADVVLARRIGEGRSLATFRLFTWESPTISIGHNQRPDALDLDACARDGIRVVRRPTGGRALLHCDEITYSAIFPVTSSLYDPQLLANYEKISGILRSALEPFSVSFDQKKEGESESSYANSELCFARALSYELTVGGKKLVGSAQRRWQKAVLQHGSILLGPCHEKMGAYLNLPSEEREEEIQRLRESTTFLKRFYVGPISLEEFSVHIRKSVEAKYAIQMDGGNLDTEEEKAIQDLRKTYRIL